VIGHVANSRQGGYGFLEGRFDALPERDIGHAAPLATARHAYHDGGVLHVDQVDGAAVLRYDGIDLTLENVRDLIVDGVVVDGRGSTGVYSRGGRCHGCAQGVLHPWDQVVP